MELRAATVADVASIASLHADSWRRSYRGIYSDAYLDDEAPAERLLAWTERFANPHADQRTVVATQDRELVGFVHTVLDDDPQWGALLDNLHVRADWQRHRLGSRLVAAPHARSSTSDRAAPCTSGSSSGTPTPARSTRRGRNRGRTGRREAPDGTEIVVLRVAWPDPTAAIRSSRPGRPPAELQAPRSRCGAPHLPASAGHSPTASP